MSLHLMIVYLVQIFNHHHLPKLLFVKSQHAFSTSMSNSMANAQIALLTNKLLRTKETVDCQVASLTKELIQMVPVSTAQNMNEPLQVGTAAVR